MILVRIRMTTVLCTIHVPLWTAFIPITNTSWWTGCSVMTVTIGITSCVQDSLLSLCRGNQLNSIVDVYKFKDLHYIKCYFCLMTWTTCFIQYVIATPNILILISDMTPRLSGHFLLYLAWFSWYSSLFRELQGSGVVKKPWSHIRIKNTCNCLWNVGYAPICIICNNSNKMCIFNTAEKQWQRFQEHHL